MPSRRGQILDLLQDERLSSTKTSRCVESMMPKVSTGCSLERKEVQVAEHNMNAITMSRLFAVVLMFSTLSLEVSAMDPLGLELDKWARRTRRSVANHQKEGVTAPYYYGENMALRRHPQQNVQHQVRRATSGKKDKNKKKAKKEKDHGGDCQLFVALRWRYEEIQVSRVQIREGEIVSQNGTLELPFEVADKVLVNTPVYFANNLTDPIGTYAVVNDFLPNYGSLEGSNSYTVSYVLEEEMNEYGYQTSSVHVQGYLATDVDAWNGGTGRFFGKFGIVEGKIEFDEEGNILGAGFDFLTCA